MTDYLRGWNDCREAAAKACDSRYEAIRHKPGSKEEVKALAKVIRALACPEDTAVQEAS
jgi:hypothetical protein